MDTIDKLFGIVILYATLFLILLNFNRIRDIQLQIESHILHYSDSLNTKLE